MISLVSPSPVKKKMSLGDYMLSRRNTSSGTTPAGDKPQVQTAVQDSGNNKGSDDITDHTQESTSRAKPDDSVKQKAAAEGGLQGSAIDDTDMRDDAEEPEYSPPEPVEPTAELNMVDSSKRVSTVSPQVSQILAQLSQMDKVRRQSAGSS